jgi:hypothetical protein
MRDKANNKIFSTKARILFKIWRMPFDAITIYLTRLSMGLSDYVAFREKKLPGQASSALLKKKLSLPSLPVIPSAPSIP